MPISSARREGMRTMPNGKSKKETTRIKNTLRLIVSMKPYSLEMIATIVTTFLKHIGTIGSAGIVAYMAALAMEGRLLSEFPVLFSWLCVCIVLRAVMYYGEMWFGHDVAYRVLRDFRIKLYDKLETISPAFVLKKRSGQIGATLMSDVEILEWFLAHTFGSFLVAVAITIVLLILLAKIHILLSILMMIFSILTLWTPFLLKKKADEQGRKVREKAAEANAVTIEGIQGLRELLTLNYLERYKERNKESMQNLYDAQLTYGKRAGTESALMQIFVGAFTVVVMAVTAVFVSQDVLAFEVYPMVVMLSALLFSPIIEVCGVARNLGNVFAAADRIQMVFDAAPVVKDDGKDMDCSSLQHRVVFEHVSFRYDDDLDKVLDDVSFAIEPGQTVALVGPSGAGKSTCINLLLRYWDAEGGSIRIGGVDIRHISLDNLRDLTAAVLQDVFLFNVSIRENIRLGRPEATDGEIEEAAKAAYAHDFIMEQPHGYDTIAGERGFCLSGGQRQRIAIARAILKNPPILVLDEAVSSLDSENEKFIQQALQDKLGNRTTVVVAHRLSTIMAADKLVVLDKGRVVQVGHHSELIAQEGFYKDLVANQVDKSGVLKS